MSETVAAPTTLDDAFRRVFAEAQDIMVARQRKYGPHNIGRHGVPGIVVRLGDKSARLNRYAIEDHRDEMSDESVEDTLFDVMNYGAIAIAWQRGLWDKEGCPPLQETVSPNADLTFERAFRALYDDALVTVIAPIIIGLPEGQWRDLEECARNIDGTLHGLDAVIAKSHDVTDNFWFTSLIGDAAKGILSLRGWALLPLDADVAETTAP